MKLTKLWTFAVTAALGITANQATSYETESETGSGAAVANSSATGTNTTGTSNSTCSDYNQLVQINDKLAMYYVVNGPSNSSDSGTISVKLEFTGTAWIAIGVSPDGSGSMIGTQAVIGLPAAAVSTQNPGEYSINSKDNSGVALRSSNLQTLMNGTIVQQNGVTTMTFIKKLIEPNKAPIQGSGVNTFVWAYGSSNALSIHAAQGSFPLTLSPCTASTTGLQTETITSSSGYSDSQKKKMWTAHAILGLIGWAFLAPTAFSASWFRKFLSSWGALWFKIHFYCNITVFVLTFTGFVLAVLVYNNDGDQHFSEGHQAMGLAIFVLVMFQAMGGILRPSLPHHKSTDDDEDDDDQASNPVEGPDIISSAKEAPVVHRSKLRVAWEAAHKLMGAILIVLGLWQVYTGIVLYSENFATPDYTTAFWATLGTCVGLFLVGTVYLRVKEHEEKITVA